MKVLFIVTHLLGSGHLSRVLTLARAFAAAGHDAHVVSGGMPVPHLIHDGVTLHQLPPLRSDGVDFTRLLTLTDAVAAPEDMAERQSRLIAIIQRERLDVLITELFPFGRRSLRDEVIAALDVAKDLAAPPLILSSVRDILAPPSKPRKVTFAADTLATYYDGVLVHSDPALVPLDLSWPVDAALAKVLHYTGFVAPAPSGPHPQKAGLGEIIVSAGGGDVGDDLFAAAQAAAQADAGRTWRILVGGSHADARVNALQDRVPANVIVESARADFRQMLHHAAASVSMCGYNTAQDILQTACPAVFVPFDAGQEVEQMMRAKALASLDGIEVLPSAKMTPQSLRAAISAACASDTRAIEPYEDGAAKAVQITQDQLRHRI